MICSNLLTDNLFIVGNAYNCSHLSGFFEPFLSIFQRRGLKLGIRSLQLEAVVTGHAKAWTSDVTF